MKKLFLTFAFIFILVFACTACDSNNMPDHAHTYGEWETTKEPTCTEEGTKVRYCACLAQDTETIPVNPDAHNYGWKSDATCHWQACQNEGCTFASDDTTTHTWDDEDTCTVCLRYKDDGVKFTKLSDGTYAVADYTGNAFEVIIPSTYCGIPVTSIVSYAFSNCRNLLNINISNGVTSIGDSAFSGCSNLRSITIPNSVTSIRSKAFSSCKNLTSITIPNSVTSIGAGAFQYCTNLESINIPDGVTSIENMTFQKCEKLTSINIPNGVTSIGVEAFQDCTHLVSITIPNSVTSIGSGAFYGCERLTSITIPKGVTTIENYTFSFCYSLASITIPEGVRIIGYRPFVSCQNLTSITFDGTVTQWNNISKDSDWDIYTPTITVTCTNGTVTE